MIEAAIIMPPVISAVERQIGARAEDRDLGHEPDELRRAADPEVAVERLALHRQGAAPARRPQCRMLSLSIPIALITCELRASDSAAASASAACRPAWPRRSEVAFWLISAISARAKPATTAMKPRSR